MLKRWIRWITLFEFRINRSEFYRDLSEMFKRSESMLSFLEGEIVTAQRTQQRSRAAALRQILRQLQSGHHASCLNHLLEGVVPSSDAMLLLAIERTADKSAALNALADAVEQQAAIKRLLAIYAALPLVMLPLCYGLITLLSKVIMAIQQSAPDFIQEELWKGFNGLAKEIAEFMNQHGLTAFFSFVLLILALIASLPRWRGLLRLRFERWPIFSLYRDFQTGLLLTSIAMLLQTGQTLKGAIEDLSGTSSRWLRWHLRRVLAGLDDKPNAPIEAFGRGLLSPYMLARVATLHRSAPTFSDVLIELGTQEGSRVLKRVKISAMTANAAMVAILCGLSGFMAMASITVPSRFSSLMEPSSQMMLKSIHTEKMRQVSDRKKP